MSRQTGSHLNVGSKSTSKSAFDLAREKEEQKLDQERKMKQFDTEWSAIQSYVHKNVKSAVLPY